MQNDFLMIEKVQFLKLILHICRNCRDLVTAADIDIAFRVSIWAGQGLVVWFVIRETVQ